MISFIIILTSFSSFSCALSPRTSKFLGFGVGLVRFANTQCVGTDGLEGICFTKRECRRLGGSGSGSCANGIGTCCTVQKTCDGSTSSNNTYFTSPNFPTLYKGGNTCTFTIQKLSDDICQVRIDFIAFTLDQPDTDGTCLNDGLTITGTNGVPTICGENSGQHIYLEFPTKGNIQLNIYTGNNANLGRIWNFKITQIGCDCPTRAPTGCLMYFTSLTGTVTSFNYGTTANSASTRQLNNQNYGICIKPQPGYCSINWEQTPKDQFSFTVSGDTDTAVTDASIGTTAAAVTGITCTTDFVIVPNPTFTDTMLAANVDRFCGNGFEPLSSSSKPFVLTVVNDGTETGDMGNRGFSLDFSQQKCSTVPLG